MFVRFIVYVGDVGLWIVFGLSASWFDSWFKVCPGFRPQYLVQYIHSCTLHVLIIRDAIRSNRSCFKCNAQCHIVLLFLDSYHKASDWGWKAYFVIRQWKVHICGHTVYIQWKWGYSDIPGNVRSKTCLRLTLTDMLNVLQKYLLWPFHGNFTNLQAPGLCLNRTVPYTDIASRTGAFHSVSLLVHQEGQTLKGQAMSRPEQFQTP